jgi:hypothetical protein
MFHWIPHRAAGWNDYALFGHKNDKEQQALGLLLYPLR